MHKMRLILSTILFSCTFAAWWDGPKCSWQTPSFLLEDTQRTWVNFGGLKGDSALGCWSDKFSCGSTRLTGSFTKKWKAWFTDEEYSEIYTYTTEAKRCIGDSACNQLAGGEDSCEYSAYTFQKWRPRSCNESAGFNALTEDHDVRLYFQCCNDKVNHWCNKEVDYSTSTCSRSDKFSQYMTDLNVCWNDFKYDFMKDLLCDDELGDILTYSDECANNDGSWNVWRRAERNCTYRATCAPELRALLTEYGSCACGAAATGGFSGEFIGTAMETNWNRWCPGIEIECAADGVMKLLYKYWRARYRFRVAIASAVITEAIKTRIREKIAERLNVEVGRVSITEDTSTTRRLVAGETSAFNVDITSDDLTTNNWLKSQLNSLDIGADISGALNGTNVSDTSVTSTAVEDESTGTYEGDVQGGTVNKYIMSSVVFVVMIFAFIH